MTERRLDGQVAVVTGAGRGIGRAAATALSGAGADLVLAARSIEGLEETARMVRAVGRSGLVVPTDVTRREDVGRLASAALAEFGRVDVLVNVAGGWAGRAPFVEMDVEAIAEMADVDVKGTFYVTHALLPTMIRQGRGTIVGIGAVEVVPGREEVVAYAAVKSALVTFHRGLREEVRPHGIRVGIVYPGLTANDLDYSPEPAALPNEDGRHRLALKDVAEAILYVAAAPPYASVEDVALAAIQPVPRA
jgi:NADP-dependent 3-hydroxy acid dehydrogenase YdfG